MLINLTVKQFRFEIFSSLCVILSSAPLAQAVDYQPHIIQPVFEQPTFIQPRMLPSTIVAPQIARPDIVKPFIHEPNFASSTFVKPHIVQPVFDDNSMAKLRALRPPKITESFGENHPRIHWERREVNATPTGQRGDRQREIIQLGLEYRQQEF